MKRAVLDFGGGRAGGKTAKADREVRAALREGASVLFCGPSETAIVSLASDGFTLARTPLPPADPALWTWDATTGDLVNVADRSKRRPAV